MTFTIAYALGLVLVGALMYVVGVVHARREERSRRRRALEEQYARSPRAWEEP